MAGVPGVHTHWRREDEVVRYRESKWERIGVAQVRVGETPCRIGERDRGAEGRGLHHGVVGKRRHPRVQEYPSSAPNARLAVAEWIVRETESRRKIIPGVGTAVGRKAGVACEYLPRIGVR